MATRNQVLSLFGASPEQILEQRRREQAAEVLKQRDPFQRAGGAIGVGLARLFGGEPAEVTRQRELYSQLEGVNFENPEQMRAAAASLAPQFPDRALQLLGMAEQSEARQQQIATSAAQQAQAEAAIETVSVPIYREVQKTDPITQQTTVSLVPDTITVATENAPFYRDRFRQQTEQMDIQGGGAETASRALPEGSIQFNTGQGTPVALLPSGKYATVTDDGNIGVLLDEQALKQLGGLVDPKKVEPPRPPELPVVKQRREEIEQKITEDRLKQPSTAAQDQTNPFSF